jgi:cytidylate kinase
MLMTNDGRLAHRLTHPRYAHKKVYEAVLEGGIADHDLEQWRRGVLLDDQPTAPVEITVLQRSASETLLRLTLQEGRKRQIRRIAAAFGHPVRRLVRIAIGPLELGDLRPGDWRYLSEKEIQRLRVSVEDSTDEPVREKGATLGDLTNRPTRGVDRLKLPAVIAIDGPAASGKSTAGHLLAEKLNYLYLDTGSMYRAMTLAALRAGVDPGDEEAVTALSRGLDLKIKPSAGEADGRLYTVLLDGEDITWEIRSPEVDAHVSAVSSYPGVREEMVRRQREIGAHGAVVMVGRDIGTVVMPEAPLKLFLTAAREQRAKRRWLDRQALGHAADYEEILADMNRRDQFDSSRQHSPLRPADDALIIDNTGKTPEDVLAEILALITPPEGKEEIDP